MGFVVFLVLAIAANCGAEPIVDHVRKLDSWTALADAQESAVIGADRIEDISRNLEAARLLSAGCSETSLPRRTCLERAHHVAQLELKLTEAKCELEEVLARGEYARSKLGALRGENVSPAKLSQHLSTRWTRKKSLQMATVGRLRHELEYQEGYLRALEAGFTSGSVSENSIREQQRRVADHRSDLRLAESLVDQTTKKLAELTRGQ